MCSRIGQTIESLSLASTLLGTTDGKSVQVSERAPHGVRPLLHATHRLLHSLSADGGSPTQNRGLTHKPHEQRTWPHQLHVASW